MATRIHQDLMYLAGQLLHRSSQSECEREAADFIEKRFNEHTRDVSVEQFHCIENYPHLYASYLSEFLVVGILSLWWPLLAFLYGGAIFVIYLVEFSGFRGVSRFLPQFPSQNVVARFLGTRPRSLIIVTAHYDSGCASSLSAPSVLPWLRTIQNVLLGTMVVVLATCVAEFISGRDNEINEIAIALRWVGISVLLTGALALFSVSSQGEDIRGANSNASGVAALLQIAEALEASPIEEADVWLVATGSHESWMGGMRQLLVEHRIDRENTYFLNIEGVGAGALRYLAEEGMLNRLRCAPAMARIAEGLSDEFGVTAGIMRAVPTEAHIPLMRELQAMTIMGLDDDGLPPHWNQISDRMVEVDEKQIATVAGYSGRFLRALATAHATEATYRGDRA